MKNLWCVLSIAAIPCLISPANAEVISGSAADLLGSESVEVNYNAPINASDSSSLVAQGAKTKAIPYGDTPRGRNYVSISGNLTFLQNSASNISYPYPGIGLDTNKNEDLDRRFQPTIAIGRSIQDTRLELELNRITVKDDPDSETGTGISVNGYYDFLAKRKVSPYIGGGAGFVFGDGENYFAWQVKGGVAYKVSREGDVYGEVKYINVNMGKISRSGYTAEVSVDGYAVGVGYRHHF